MTRVLILTLALMATATESAPRSGHSEALTRCNHCFSRFQLCSYTLSAPEAERREIMKCLNYRNDYLNCRKNNHCKTIYDEENRQKKDHCE